MLRKLGRCRPKIFNVASWDKHAKVDDGAEEDAELSCRCLLPLARPFVHPRILLLGIGVGVACN